MKLTEKQKQLIFETVIRNEKKKHINENNLGIPQWAIEHGFKHNIHELDGQIVRGWRYAACFETEDGIIYYCPIGVRHTKKCARLTDYYIDQNFDEPQEVEKRI